MIHKIKNTSQLYDVFFEDIDELVNTQEECYLINAWYYYYYSSLSAAKIKAKKIGISQEVFE